MICEGLRDITEICPSAFSPSILIKKAKDSLFLLEIKIIELAYWSRHFLNSSKIIASSTYGTE